MTTPTAGQAPANPPTDPAGQAPATPATPPTAGAVAPPWERTGEPFDAARAWALIENLRADLAAARAGQAPAPTTPQTQPALAGEPAGADDAASVAAQVAELRTQLARERAARRHGLDDDLVELLGSGTDEQIEARAKTLADRLTAVGQAPATGVPVPRRPVEALRGGADPTVPVEETDPGKLADLIRSRSLF